MFNLDPRLDADTIEVTELELCKVLLMNDANYPWLILVPKRPEMVELSDLSADDYQQLWQESLLVSNVMHKVFRPDKLNVAALGNIVRQLHLHHVARTIDDAAWPGPVWGKVPAKAYTELAIVEMLARLRPLLKTKDM